MGLLDWIYSGGLRELAQKDATSLARSASTRVSGQRSKVENRESNLNT